MRADLVRAILDSPVLGQLSAYRQESKQTQIYIFVKLAFTMCIYRPFFLYSFGFGPVFGVKAGV